MTIHLLNRLSEIDRLSRLAEAFGKGHQLPADLMYQVTLALDEVVTNIIKYGYDAPGDHIIVTTLALDGDVLLTQVEDDGHAFNPLEAPPPDIDASLHERPIGGLGIHLIRSLMDSLEYRRENGRNVLIMRKRASPSGQGSG